MSEREFRLEKNKYLKLNIEKQGYYPYNNAILADQDKTEFIYLHKILNETADEIGFGTRINDIATAVGCYRKKNEKLIGYAVLDSVYRTSSPSGYRTDKLSNDLNAHGYYYKNDTVAQPNDAFINVNQENLFIPHLMASLNIYESTSGDGGEEIADPIYPFYCEYNKIKPVLPDCVTLKVILENADSIDNLDTSSEDNNYKKINMFKNTPNQKAHTCVFTQDKKYCMVNSDGTVEKIDNPNYNLYGWCIPIFLLPSSSVPSDIQYGERFYLRNGKYEFPVGTFLGMVGNYNDSDINYGLIVLDAKYRSHYISYGTFDLSTYRYETIGTNEDVSYYESTPHNLGYYTSYFSYTTSYMQNFNNHMIDYYTPKNWGFYLPRCYANDSLKNVDKSDWTVKITNPMLPTANQLKKIKEYRTLLDDFDPTVMYDEDNNIISEKSLTSWSINGQSKVVTSSPSNNIDTAFDDIYGLFTYISIEDDYSHEINIESILKSISDYNRLPYMEYENYGIIPIIEFEVDKWIGEIDTIDSNIDNSKL